MKFISNNMIEISRELSDLDLFTIQFTKILRKHVRYVIISGYVAILLGRARSSEDVDIIIPKTEFSKLLPLLKELKENGFYCLNAEDDKEIFKYLNDNLAIRFARTETIIPNIELKFAKNNIDEITLKKTIIVKLKKEEITISHLELQIAFNEIVLKTPKDMEDARHIRNVAKGYLDDSLIKRYKEKLKNEFC